MTFRTPEEAIESANNTPYGLSAGVWTDKGSKIFKMVTKLRAGVVWANTYNKFDPELPVRRLQGKRLRPRGRPAGAARLPRGGLMARAKDNKSKDHERAPAQFDADTSETHFPCPHACGVPRRTKC